MEITYSYPSRHRFSERKGGVCFLVSVNSISYRPNVMWDTNGQTSTNDNESEGRNNMKFLKETKKPDAFDQRKI